MLHQLQVDLILEPDVYRPAAATDHLSNDEISLASHEVMNYICRKVYCNAFPVTVCDDAILGAGCFQSQWMKLHMYA